MYAFLYAFLRYRIRERPNNTFRTNREFWKFRTRPRAPGGTNVVCAKTTIGTGVAERTINTIANDVRDSFLKRWTACIFVLYDRDRCDTSTLPTGADRVCGLSNLSSAAIRRRFFSTRYACNTTYSNVVCMCLEHTTYQYGLSCTVVMHGRSWTTYAYILTVPVVNMRSRWSLLGFFRKHVLSNRPKV